MTPHYYKSDLDFIIHLRDRKGDIVPWPDVDLEALFWTASKSRAVTVSSDPVRRDLVANYFDTVRFFSDKYRTILDSKRMLTPDLLAEQKMVSGFSDMKGWAIDVLLPDISDAAGIGYQHVYSIDKLNHMPQCIESLKAVDPEIFEITSRICGGMKSWAGYALGK